MSRNDFQKRNLSALEAKAEAQIDRAAWKVASQPAGYDDHAVTSILGERHICIGELGCGRRFPTPDSLDSSVGVSLVFHHRVLIVATNDRLGVPFFSGDIRSDWLWQGDWLDHGTVH